MEKLKAVGLEGENEAGLQFVPETWEGFGDAGKASTAAGVGGQADLAAAVLPSAAAEGLANAAAAAASTVAAVVAAAAVAESSEGGNPIVVGAQAQEEDVQEGAS